MKVLIKHSTDCPETHFQMLKQRFENVGMEVLNKNICCCVTELEAGDLKAVDYVIDFNTVTFIHEEFLLAFKKLMSLDIENIKTKEVLYFNKDMGLIISEENAVYAYDSVLVKNDFFKILHEPVEVGLAVIAIELNDKDFLSKKGKFCNEFLTSKMLENGNWSI